MNRDTAAAELESVRGVLEAWRAKRKRGDRIPEEVWQRVRLPRQLRRSVTATGGGPSVPTREFFGLKKRLGSATGERRERVSHS